MYRNTPIVIATCIIWSIPSHFEENLPAFAPRKIGLWDVAIPADIRPKQGKSAVLGPDSGAYPAIRKEDLLLLKTVVVLFQAMCLCE